MPYVVMVDDNFHYMDEDERYRHGEFSDAGVAIEHCRQIVDEYLESALKPGMSAEELWDSYKSFGGGPVHPERGRGTGALQCLVLGRRAACRPVHSGWLTA